MIRIQFTDAHGCAVLLDQKRHPSLTVEQAMRTIEKLRNGDPPWMGKFKVLMEGSGKR